MSDPVPAPDRPDERPVRPRVVVVGAGFGGLWGARHLAGKPADVVLVDRNNYHTFFPLLYQVAAAELTPTDIAFPVRALFRDEPGVRVLMAEVEGLDLPGRRVITSRGDLPYDALVLAPGSEPHFFGIPGAEEHAFPLRWMDDAVPLRRAVLERFEAASDTDDLEERRALLRFVIVGGGPTGVEFAGALAELIHGPVLRDYPRVAADEVSIVLVEGSDRVLPGMEPELSAYTLERLRRRHVEVRLDTLVEEILADAVRLPGGDLLPTYTAVWTAGIRGTPRAEAWGLPTGPAGRVPVTETLSVAEHPEVRVVGDLAFLEGPDGEPYPQVAQVAMQQGERAAANILAVARGEEEAAFRYRDYGMMAVIGRNAAVAEVFGGTFKGFPAWILWLVVHVAKLIGVRNRLLVLLNWGWNYLWFKRAVRLLLVGPPSGRSATPEL